MSILSRRKASRREAWAAALVLGAVGFEDESRVSKLLDQPGGSKLAGALLKDAKKVTGCLRSRKAALELGRSQKARIDFEEAAYIALLKHQEEVELARRRDRRWAARP
ncbi:hypothetical protein ACJJJB_00105 (plasmid) [Microbulbifer sp. ANSA001]|uniref:hypothetical protein n=1 Tax=Microbulbifer sp. ANSA001 TaxID=3243358 RepID=UPI0040414106